MSQRSSTRNRTATEKMVEYKKERRENKESTVLSEPEDEDSSDEDYNESSQCSTPSRSRENSVSSEPPKDNGPEADLMDIDVKDDGAKTSPSSAGLSDSDSRHTPETSENPTIDHTTAPEQQELTSHLQTPIKSNDGKQTDSISDTFISEEDGMISDPSMPPIPERSPQPPQTPRPPNTRTPNLHCTLTPAIDFPKSGDKAPPGNVEQQSKAVADCSNVLFPNLSTVKTLSCPMENKLHFDSHTINKSTSTSISSDTQVTPKSVDVISNNLNELKTMQGLFVSNLSTNTTQETLASIFGFSQTEYTNNMCRCKVGEYKNQDGTCERFALITAPSDIICEIECLNSISVDNQTIVIEPIPLQYFELSAEAPHNEESLQKHPTDDESIAEFLAQTFDENKAFFHCIVLSKIEVNDRVNMRSLIATSIEIKYPNKEIWKKISGSQFFDLLLNKFQKEQKEIVTVKKKREDE